MKTMLITGGLGFIGSSIARSYCDTGEYQKIIVLDNLARGSTENIADIRDKVSVVFADLRDKEACRSAFLGVHTVIHLAAVVGGISLYERKPYTVAFDNTIIDCNVLSLSKESGVTNFFYASSTHVYPHHLQMNCDARPLKESDANNRGQYLSYGVEKLYMEDMLSYAHKQDQRINIAIARYCGIFGPNQDIDLNNASLIPAMCNRAYSYPDERYMIRGDGKETRSYCYIDDAVEATKLMIDNLESRKFIGPYNVGSTDTYSVYEIASLIADVSGKGMEVEFDLSITASILGQSCSIDAIKQDLGWFPRTPFKEGLSKVYNNIGERIDNVEKKISTNLE